ncbi:MAG: TIGR00296 family protein [archaeon]
MAEFNLEDAQELINLARKSIEYYLHTSRMYEAVPQNNKFLELRGVFVTLNTYPKKQLRGCIGFPYASRPLWFAVIEAATHAAFEDPRFNPLPASELDKIVIEISILTEPKAVNKEKVEDEIKIGRDGLIVVKKSMSGLLLPQVATEYGFDVQTFLKETCKKAGLIPTAWQQDETKVFKFQAQIFTEKEPKGKIEEEIIC